MSKKLKARLLELGNIARDRFNSGSINKDIRSGIKNNIVPWVNYDPTNKNVIISGEDGTVLFNNNFSKINQYLPKNMDVSQTQVIIPGLETNYHKTESRVIDGIMKVLDLLDKELKSGTGVSVENAQIVGTLLNALVKTGTYVRNSQMKPTNVSYRHVFEKIDEKDVYMQTQLSKVYEPVTLQYGDENYD